MSESPVLHTTASLHERNGGPPRTVSALAEALGRAGEAARVLAVADGPADEMVRPDPAFVQTTWVRAGLGVARRYRRAVAEARPGLVHDHGLWLPTNHAAAQGARDLSVPLIVSTRGMLEPWARRHRRTKKRIAWAAFQRSDLARAAVLHATADSEAAGLREVDLRNPIAVIPNGVQIPAEPAAPDLERTLRRALFLSRVHPKKGLVPFLDVWAVVRPPGWELVIAGPNEEGHRQELESQAARLGLHEVRFVGSVPDADKWGLYGSADLFVLPTFSENFGVVVAEALAAGVPVLTTTGAPWEGLVQHACGWWVEPTPDALADALRAATGLSDAERRAMGNRGRAYAAEAFGWDAIADQMASVYRWVLGNAPQPPCVRLD